MQEDEKIVIMMCFSRKFSLPACFPYLSPLQSAAIEISNFVCLTPLVSLQTLPPLSEISNHPFWLAIEHIV